MLPAYLSLMAAAACKTENTKSDTAFTYDVHHQALGKAGLLLDFRKKSSAASTALM